MKKLFYALAILSLILAFSACGGTSDNTDVSSQSSGEKITEASTENPTETKSETFTETLTEKASEESSEPASEETVYEYTDISSASSPVIENNKKNSATASFVPRDNATNPSITFDGNASFTLSYVNITSASMHETIDCDECGIKDTDFGSAYYICNNSYHQGGFTVELENPIPAALVSGMTITFSTTNDIASGSQIRILPSTTVSNSAFVNECSDMGGAVGQMVTADLGMTSEDITAIADSDGMVRRFKLYFRNKDETDIYIKSIDFVISPESLNFTSLCTIYSIEGNCFSKGEAMDMVAQLIAENFSKINVAAQITVKATGHTQNTPQTAGKISYTATIILEDGTEKTIKNLSTTIPAIKNAWLERADDSPYGAITDSNEQYKNRFDRAGLIYLENNIFASTSDTLKSIEYAVISADLNVTDGSISWYAPQISEIDGDKFSIYANAFLDYGDTLTVGGDYRFVVRVVTANNNYVLHLDIPFTYEPLNAELEKELSYMSNQLWAHGYSFDNGDNVAEKVKEKIESQLNEENVEITVDEVMMGMSSATLAVKLTYTANIETNRFPVRPSDNLYAYCGEWFSFNCIATFDSIDSFITLVSPGDGARDVVIASSAIVDFMAADLEYLGSKAYPFVKGVEACLPTAVKFEWHTDGDADEYTLLISESRDMSDPLEYTTSTVEDGYSRISVYNLKAGTTYYWQIKAGDHLSNMACFTTASYPRFIFTENVSNFRDIGGYTTVDGYRVKQGLVYRSANLDSVNVNDIYTITQLLGIKTDLDLRGGSGPSPLGSNTYIYRSSIQWYTGVFAEDQHSALRYAIAAFATEEAYPIVFHCQIGRDRTGTLSTLILALLGVDEETLVREYMLSFHSVAGNTDSALGYQMIGNIKSFINGLKAYGDADATLSEHAEAFMLEIGVTAEEIQFIRDIMLEK